jgi:hypothetical protein
MRTDVCRWLGWDFRAPISAASPTSGAHLRPATNDRARQSGVRNSSRLDSQLARA